jgi:hypothetical protein
MRNCCFNFLSIHILKLEISGCDSQTNINCREVVAKRAAKKGAQPDASVEGTSTRVKVTKRRWQPSADPATKCYKS